MQSYAARYSSFTPPARSKLSKTALEFRWPHPHTYLANPTTLATAGFYFNPSASTPDAVSCFICDKGLADWDPEDDPALIHAQKCPKCPWAILKCVSATNKDSSIKFASSTRLPSSRTMGKARLATFGPDTKKWWPHETKGKMLTSKMMAKSGFMYTPAHPGDDTCICIYCGVELSGWQTDDDPMEEHRRRQAKNGPCPFFTHMDDISSLESSKDHGRSKSRLPRPSTPKQDNDAEHGQLGIRLSSHAPTSSTNNKKPRGNARSSKSKSSARSKKVAKTKAIEEEVVEEYHITLDNEDNPQKLRPKKHRPSSRPCTHASTATGSDTSDRISSSSKALSHTESLVSTSSNKKAKFKRSPSSSSQKITRGRNESEDTQRSTRSRSRPHPSEDETSENLYEQGKVMPAPTQSRLKADLGDGTEVKRPDKPPRGRKAKSKSKTMKGIELVGSNPELTPETSAEGNKSDSAPVGSLDENVGDSPTRTQGKPRTALREIEPTRQMTGSFSERGKTPQAVPFPPIQHFLCPEDAELALEEEALEKQAHDLMFAHSKTLMFASTPLDKGQAVEDPAYKKVAGTRSQDKTISVSNEDMMDVEKPALNGKKPVTYPPSTPRNQAVSTIKPPPATTRFPQLIPGNAIISLTDAEREMTVEQWVRYEMDRQYERLKSDGRRKIDAFKARAAEVSKQIEDL